MTYTLAKDFFVEDYIGDKEDVLRSIELLQMELEHFVNLHADEDLQEAPEMCRMSWDICYIHWVRAFISLRLCDGSAVL